MNSPAFSYIQLELKASPAGEDQQSVKSCGRVRPRFHVMEHSRPGCAGSLASRPQMIYSGQDDRWPTPAGRPCSTLGYGMNSQPHPCGPYVRSPIRCAMTLIHVCLQSRGYGLFATILLALAIMPQASAYPPVVTTWIWRFYEDSRFYPAQLSACTDPDGRLRMLFTDTSGFRYYNQNGVNYRVCKTVMKSFRPFSDGVIDEAVSADPGDFTSPTGTDRNASLAATQEPRRTSVYGVLSGENQLSYGGSYRHLMPGENFGTSYVRGMSYHGRIQPMAYRPVLGSEYSDFKSGSSGGSPDVLAATCRAGPVENDVSLTSLPDHGVIRL